MRPASTAARALIDRALAGGREWLTEPEAKSVLAAYGIPVTFALFTRIFRKKTPAILRRNAHSERPLHITARREYDCKPASVRQFFLHENILIN